jgi:hypothetical protein
MFGDEALHLQGGLWPYHYIKSRWHIYFQFATWAFIFIMPFIMKRNYFRAILGSYPHINLSLQNKNKLVRVVFLLLIALFFLSYFYILKSIPYNPFLSVMYTPLSKVLYLASYFIAGIDPSGPRMVQLAFYLLSSIYLYRTLILYDDKKAAIFCASLFLFLPLSIFYAHSGELHSGVIFFIVVISHFFLKFLRKQDSIDLLLTSYLIGLGFLYKRDILLMFFVCAGYLIYKGVKNKSLNLKTNLFILHLSLIPIIPWLVIGKFFTWRNYTITWSHVTSLDRLTAYFLLLPSTISWPIFIFLLVSIVFIIFVKFNELSGFFGLLFIAYYVFYTIDMAALAPRLSTAFYPSITVFLSLLLSYIVRKISGNAFFRGALIIIVAYLLIISTVFPYSARFLGIDSLKLQNFPTKDTMAWVKHNIRGKEKILVLRILPVYFYMDKYEIEKDKIITFWYEMPDAVSSLEKLSTFCNENDITYIMFPYGPQYPLGGHLGVLKNLAEDADGQFIKVAKFSNGDNAISIIRLQ